MANIVLAKPVNGLQYYDVRCPDLGLGYLTTALKRAGHRVRLVDCISLGLTDEDFLQAVEEEKPDFVGFKIYTKDLNAARQGLQLVREAAPEATTLLGGPFPSGAGALTMEMFGPDLCDYAFQGEAELGLPQLVAHVLDSGGRKGRQDEGVLETIPGLMWRTGGGEVRANPKGQVEDLDELGYPDFDALEVEKYLDGPYTLMQQGSYVPVMTGRGCPFKCTYCAGPLVTGKSTKHHSVGYVLGWFRHFIETYGVNHFSITDDNFLHERKFVRKLSQGILDSGLDVQWECTSNGIRLNQTDETTLRLMEDSGCYAVSVGVESGSPRILKAMRRAILLEDIVKATELIADVTRIKMNGFFILGYPEETEEDIQQTIDLACRLPLHRAAFFSFTPHPGTEAFRRFYEEELLQRKDTDMFKYDRISGVHPSISGKRLSFLILMATARFYLRPKHLLLILRSLDSRAKLKRLAVVARYLFIQMPASLFGFGKARREAAR